MADDIVTQIRDMAEHRGHRRTHYIGCDASHIECAALIAADEIERLRAAGDALVAAIRNHDLQESHIKAWEEARRG